MGYFRRRCFAGYTVCVAAVILFTPKQLQGVVAQTVSIQRSPSTNPLPLFSPLTLTCELSSGTSGSVSYSWDTSGCYRNSQYNNGNPTCFPHGSSSQTVSVATIRPEDAVPNLRCIATISLLFTSTTVTSSPIDITLSGLVLISGNSAITPTNVISSNSNLLEPGSTGVIARCVSGQPPGEFTTNTFVASWYFGESASTNTALPEDNDCSSGVPVVTRGASISQGFIGVVDLYRCSGNSFGTNNEGTYHCASGFGFQTQQSLNVFSSSRTAPTIDTPSQVFGETGIPVTFSCTSRGSVPDTFTWRSDGFDMGSGTLITVSHTATTAVFRSEYTYSSPNTALTGIYTCSVANFLGSDSAAVSLTIGPTDPSNVRVTVTGARSVRVDWTPSVYGAHGYSVLYFLVEPGSFVDSSDVSGGSSSSLVIDNLEEDTLYRFKVQADGNAFSSSNAVPSDGVRARTLTAAPSSPPQNVMVSSVDPSSLQVTWEPPPAIDQNGALTGYQITYSQSGAAVMAASTSATSSTYTLAGLVSFVEYSVQLAAVNADGSGPLSTSVVARSGQDVPTVPSSLMVDSVSDSMVTLSWGLPSSANGVITQYIVQYRRLTGSSNTAVNLNSSTLMYTVTGLATDVEYQFRVAAATVVGMGPFAVIVQQTGSTAPVNVTVMIVESPRRVMATWQPPITNADMVTGYIITYSPVESFASEGNVSTTSRVVTFNLPEEFVTYHITARAVFNTTLGSLSNVVTITTYSTVPFDPPRNVMVMDTDPAMLSVTYSRPSVESVNGNITGYVIRYGGVDTDESLTTMVDGDITTTVVITGLAPYTNYSVEVAAVNVNGTGPFSDPVIGLSGQLGPGSPPQSLNVVTIESSFMVVSWMEPAAPNGVILTYEIQYRALNETNVLNVSNTLMATIEGLASDTLYTVKIRAFTRVSGGPYSNKLNVTTLPQAPDPVTNVTLSSMSSTTLTIHWVEPFIPHGLIIHYNLFYLPVSNPYGSIMSSKRKRRQLALEGELATTFTESPGTLTNLNGSVTYSIQLSAVAMFNGQELIGDRSTAIMATTLEGVPSAPLNVASFNVTKVDVGISWERPDRPNGLITDYTVTHDVSKVYFNQSTREMEVFNDNDTMDVMATFDVIMYSTDFTDLLPGTQYQFSVVAYTGVGEGTTTDLLVSTLPDAPPSPPTPQVSKIADHTAVLDIQQTSDIYGAVIYYSVVVQKDYNDSLLAIGSDPYNKEAASQAATSGQSYGYIAGIVLLPVNSYPYSYTLGDDSRSNNREVDYDNTALQANTTYAVMVRAYTSDQLYADSIALVFRTNVSSVLLAGVGTDECSYGVVIGVAALLAAVVIAFVMSLAMNVYCWKQRKRAKFSISGTNSKSSVQKFNTVKDETQSDDVYETVGTHNMILPNPAFDEISMEENPSYKDTDHGTDCINEDYYMSCS